MSESKSTTMSEGRAHSLPERAKEKIEAILHHHKSSCHHKRETHGLDDSINENTSLDDVRAPNVFERAKEEFEALAQVFHHKKEEPTSDIRDGNQVAESRHKQEIPSSPSSETKTKAENIFVKAKEEIKAMIHHDKSKHHHDKETHGRSDDIDENTPTNEVKGPDVFERVKEEFEAVFQAIHPKKES
ncbi:uncharacterized protein LOC130726644 [Lotus japonicus]|uniref:uncharacterized protein LOC130726644 n=1 Tax=Lotus japonicus TaxID=34305 RepID=UPI002588FAC1|nr:uncharacterized protein LOC130726644 [Lotus japonicus]